MSLTCLIVDDSDEFLISATRLFSLQDVTVVGLASTGNEALRLAAILRPDVALVDVELGDEDGIELARRISSDRARTSVILISLRDRSELAELVADCGAVGFLRKDMLGARAIEDLMPQRR